MTKYSDRQDQEHNEMQSDMAEGSANWPDADPSDDFAEASGSGHGPGKIRDNRVTRSHKVHKSNFLNSVFFSSSHSNQSSRSDADTSRPPGHEHSEGVPSSVTANLELANDNDLFAFCIFHVRPMN